MRNALIAALRSMSDAEATDLWRAVSQWSESVRNFRDESDDALPNAEASMLAACEKIEHAGDAFLATLADGA